MFQFKTCQIQKKPIWPEDLLGHIALRQGVHQNINVVSQCPKKLELKRKKFDQGGWEDPLKMKAEKKTTLTMQFDLTPCLKLG